MSETVANSTLERLSQFVSTQMGLHFPPERWADLRKGLDSAAVEFGFSDATACADWLVSSPLTKQQIEVLASDLTVGETYFFREKKAFEVLEHQILPSLISRRRGMDSRLRIWSAGCCTGEEAYSLAIVLTRLLPDRADWDIKLLATDINPRFLRKAAEGVYGEWSFRDAPPGLKERYFEPTSSGRYRIRADIKEMVQFDYINLADDTFPSLLNNTNALDLILCRNVLIYMGPQQIATMVGKFSRALVEQGWLLVGAAETSHVTSRELSVVNVSGLTAYRRLDQGSGQPSSEIPTARWIEPTRQKSTLADFTPTNSPQPVGFPSPTIEALSAPIARGRTPEPAEAACTFDDAVRVFEQGHYAKAVDTLMPLAAQGRATPRVLELLARACANKGDLAAALRWGQQALAEDRLNSRMHYLCGMIQEELTMPSEAAASFRRALYLDPDFIMAYFALGHLAQRQGRIAEGLRNCENALRLLRGHPAEALVPESEGMSAGRLAEMIARLTDRNLTN